MQKRFRIYAYAVLVVSQLAACASKQTPTPVDIVGTVAARLAATMLTQTAAAASPTPLPVTDTPMPTATDTLEPTKDPTINIITVVVHAPCRRGPNASDTLISYINVPKKVLLLGVGSIPGWYVIKNPYFSSPCWVAAADVQLDPNMDITVFPVMTPSH